jgi:hypothetical protein
VVEDCLLILGSDVKPAEKLDAFKNLCGTPKIYSDFMSVRANYCQAPTDKIPEDLLKASKTELYSYIQIQSSKPKNASGIQKAVKNSCTADLGEKMNSIQSNLPKLQYAENQSSCFLLADEISGIVGMPNQCEKIIVAVKDPSVQSVLQFTDHQDIIAKSKLRSINIEWLVDWLGTKVEAMTYGKCRAKFRESSE